MNVSANISKRQFITSFRARTLYLHDGDLARALISVQQRIFLMLLGLHDQGSSRKNPQFLNRSV
jgi:hypothetical protein